MKKARVAPLKDKRLDRGAPQVVDCHRRCTDPNLPYELLTVPAIVVVVAQ